MKTVASPEAPEAPTPNAVDASTLQNDGDAGIVGVTLHPGQALQRHITPVPLGFHILEGVGSVEIRGERRTVSADIRIDSRSPASPRQPNEDGGDVHFLVARCAAPPAPATGYRNEVGYA